METKMSKKDILIRDMKREGMVMDGIQVRKKKSIEKLRDLEVGVQEFFLIVLFCLFVAALSYWAYELWYIHTTEFSALTAIPIGVAAAHEAAAFQAAILAFLLATFFVYIL
tara:strand:- start:4242 stop:4574 length:333 start_codon:yes stop_codon:yes gene_type:complete